MIVETINTTTTARVGKGTLTHSHSATRNLSWLHIIQQDLPGYIHNCAVNCFFRGRTSLP